MAQAFFTPVFLQSGKDRRITIPQQHCKKIAWVTGGSTVSGWFLVLAPGRFRLLSDTDVERDEKLSNVRSQIIDGPTGLDSASPVEFESSARAAVLGRLVPVSIDSSFRIVVPKEVLPAEQDRWAFVLLFSMGYLEIWLANIYNDALACPLYSAL